ncbi:MAG TPA: hypothetical protein VE172_16625 [Stackebrandtia sp.]|jgi:hypothetical protein|uniref:hypothetical protein n=1 Tax=Stackebrandtia sp. TaxID=2023065 RepID=UPI002D5D4CCA|nr:hypothetical protein [Stackebrandtia sp.]HZE40428.1 hypothetical protein [Stackebrandtia sp.]
MAGSHAYTLSADDPHAVAEAVGRAAAGSVVRLVRGDEQIADITPPDPDAAFRPLLAEIEARAAAITAAHPDPDDLENWQRAERLHHRWRTTGRLPSEVDYASQLRKLNILSPAQIAEQASAMVCADAEALIYYPLPER